MTDESSLVHLGPNKVALPFTVKAVATFPRTPFQMFRISDFQFSLDTWFSVRLKLLYNRICLISAKMCQNVPGKLKKERNGFSKTAKSWLQISKTAKSGKLTFWLQGLTWCWNLSVCNLAKWSFLEDKFNLLSKMTNFISKWTQGWFFVIKLSGLYGHLSSS